MTQTRRKRPKVKRSSVSLDSVDYARLQRIAADHRPPLPVRYVIEYAVVEFLKAAPEGPIDIADLRGPKR